jgi:pyruvate dehydrogenase E1 component beta subunit
MVERALAAAEILAAGGTDVEVIDLRSVQPLDEETILASVRRTGRLVIVHEAPVRGGFGGEIAAIVADKAFGYLDAPIQRVGAPWTPVPFGPRLVAEYVPSEASIVAAVHRTRAALVG